MNRPGLRGPAREAGFLPEKPSRHNELNPGIARGHPTRNSARGAEFLRAARRGARPGGAAAGSGRARRRQNVSVAIASTITWLDLSSVFGASPRRVTLSQRIDTLKRTELSSTAYPMLASPDTSVSGWPQNFT